MVWPIIISHPKLIWRCVRAIALMLPLFIRMLVIVSEHTLGEVEVGGWYTQMIEDRLFYLDGRLRRHLCTTLR